MPKNVGVTPALRESRNACKKAEHEDSATNHLPSADLWCDMSMPKAQEDAPPGVDQARASPVAGTRMKTNAGDGGELEGDEERGGEMRAEDATKYRAGCSMQLSRECPPDLQADAAWVVA